MRSLYAELFAINNELIGEYTKRARNHEELLAALKEVNQMIQKAAKMRGAHCVLSPSLPRARSSHSCLGRVRCSWLRKIPCGQRVSRSHQVQQHPVLVSHH